MNGGNRQAKKLLEIYVFICLSLVLVGVVGFFAGDRNGVFSKLLLITIPLLIAWGIYDLIGGLLGLRHQRCREHLARAIVATYWIGMLSATGFMAWSGRFSPGVLAWLLPVEVLVIPYLLAILHGPLREGKLRDVLWYALIGLVAGAATYAQIALIQHLDTWVVVRVGALPVPLLGLTVAVSGIIAAYCGFITLFALVFHALRGVLSVP